MRFLLAIFLALLSSSCSPRPPVDLVLYEQPSPRLAALAHARERPSLPRSGDGWIMDGIANAHYEGGAYIMLQRHYVGLAVQVYTRRPKP